MTSSIGESKVVQLICKPDVKRLFLVNSPLTLDWILLKTLFGEPEIAYLVFDAHSNIQFYTGQFCYDIDKSEELVTVVEKVGFGWSREATLDELTVMTRLSDKLNDLLGDLVSTLGKEPDSESTNIVLASR